VNYRAQCLQQSFFFHALSKLTKLFSLKNSFIRQIFFVVKYKTSIVIFGK